MPKLLYRYILGDLLRVFVLTTAVLVTIIAFGATIKPLTEDGLLGIGETIKYLFLAMVPMMQFALPFAAGFSSTVVLHRMASDNEILAAAASGISYQRLLSPIAGLGLVLVLVMVLLTQWAIPRFWAIMEQTIASDITRLFEASIDSGQPFKLGDLQIYADNMWVVANPSDTQADTRLILSRVVAAELDSDGRIETDVTANQAVVDIHRVDGETYLKLVLTDAVAFDGHPGQLARLPQLEPANAIHIPNVLRNEMRAMTRWQLLALRSNPDMHGRVLTDRMHLADVIQQAEIWSTMTDHLAHRNTVTLIQQGPSQRRYVVHATAIRGGYFVHANNEPVMVQQYEGETLIRQMTANSVSLSRLSAAAMSVPSFDLELLDAVVTDMRSDGAVNRRERLVDQNLVPDGIRAIDYSALDSSTLLALAREDEPIRRVQNAVDRLERRITDMDNEITGRLLNRYAQSTTVLLLLLMGASLAMWLRGTMPLVIYIWAFAPSVLALILISGGDKMIRDGDFFSGLSVMWSGNIFMVGLIVFAFSKLRRN
jgi:lipopolysaccharide export LptBFGC system permease protein LptF